MTGGHPDPLATGGPPEVRAAPASRTEHTTADLPQTPPAVAASSDHRPFTSANSRDSAEARGSTAGAATPPSPDSRPEAGCSADREGRAPSEPAPVWLTWLYVPGDRPETVAKALRSGADVVLVDLEDAVAPERKRYALEATAELLAQPHPGPAPVHVRISALDGPLAETQVRTLAPLPGLGGLRLPKVSCPAEVRRVAEWTVGGSPSARTGTEPDPDFPDRSPTPDGPPDRERQSTAAVTVEDARVPPLLPLLESAAGIEQAHQIATAHPAVRGIALGEADLSADLGIRDETALNWPRSRAVVAARAAGLPPPAQSVYPDIRDIDGLARSCAAGRALGFLGRTAIHPRQLPVIERAFLPTPEEVAKAEEVVAAAVTDSGALALPDGRFVDAAVVAAARRVLHLAERRPEAAD